VLRPVAREVEEVPELGDRSTGFQAPDCFGARTFADVGLHVMKVRVLLAHRAGRNDSPAAGREREMEAADREIQEKAVAARASRHDQTSEDGREPEGVDGDSADGGHGCPPRTS
jgi:hypothetical protein